jgi:hypothetical protein
MVPGTRKIKRTHNLQNIIATVKKIISVLQDYVHTNQ